MSVDNKAIIIHLQKDRIEPKSPKILAVFSSQALPISVKIPICLLKSKQDGQGKDQDTHAELDGTGATPTRGRGGRLGGAVRGGCRA